MRNPLRNERDAFRLLAIVLSACLAVGLLALVSKTVAVAVAAVLLVVGLIRTAGWVRRWVSSPSEDGAEGPDSPTSR